MGRKGSEWFGLYTELCTAGPVLSHDDDEIYYTNS
jgi:hypothetical protein